VEEHGARTVAEAGRATVGQPGNRRRSRTMCAMGRPCGAYRKGGMKLECNGAARCGYTECYHYKPHAVEEDECEKWTYCPANHGKPSTVCSKRFNGDWFREIVSFLVDRGTEGLILLATSESFDAQNRGCDARAGRFDSWLAEMWAGMKSWNRGSRPSTAPAGYFLEYHPLKAGDPCRPDCIVLTDTSLGKALDKADGTIDPAKLIPYAKKVHNRRQGFVYYGHSFTADKIDVDGLKAIGKAGSDD